MTWQSAQTEAKRRIGYLPIPPTGSLTGLTINLLAFETDAVAGFLAGGNSALFQWMVNRAAKRILEKRGATVKVRTVTLAETMEWNKVTVVVKGHAKDGDNVSR